MHDALEIFLENRTVLSVAHRLSTIQAAEHVNVLQGGHLAEEGTFEALIAREGGVFKQLVAKQLSVE
jgi:ATP-binding cassette subfamily B protein